jgi:hypothetical protein
VASGLTVGDLIDLGDLDELIRRVDDLCDSGDWPGLLDLRDRSRAAFERGRQLWPAASHAEYRLALQAPGRFAAAVLAPGAGRFALGPLSEVAASTHTWDELGRHLGSSPDAALVAQERVLRGEDLRDQAGRLPPSAADLPLVLQPWERGYPQATYKPYTAEFGDVPAPPFGEVAATRASGQVDDPEAVRALVDLVTPWTTQSAGRVSAVAVEGDAVAALGALGLAEARVAEVDAGHAFALMAWTAASGGAHGRRRGMAQGRFAAWWAAAALADALDAWPLSGGDMAAELEGLRWYRWERLEPFTGWALRLAAEHPVDGRAWAVEATDSADTSSQD